jgi:hypothetical protein
MKERRSGDGKKKVKGGKGSRGEEDNKMRMERKGGLGR